MMTEKKKWTEYNYKAVNLPNDLLNEVDKYVKKSKLFTNRSEFVKAAIRDKLEDRYKKS